MFLIISSEIFNFINAKAEALCDGVVLLFVCLLPETYTAIGGSSLLHFHLAALTWFLRLLGNI